MGKLLQSPSFTSIWGTHKGCDNDAFHAVFFQHLAILWLRAKWQIDPVLPPAPPLPLFSIRTNPPLLLLGRLLPSLTLHWEFPNWLFQTIGCLQFLRGSALLRSFALFSLIFLSLVLVLPWSFLSKENPWCSERFQPFFSVFLGVF